MKLLTIAIPSYNSESYLERCLDSLLIKEDERLDIIVVDDGSTDRTAEIANKYVERYPDLISLVSKENGGHGSAVNAGMDHARGRWFYVLDSDDRLDFSNLELVLERLDEFEKDDESEPDLDLFLVNYVYDKVGEKDKVVSYEDKIPENRVFSWVEMKKLGTATFLTMHSMIYRTKLLKDCKLRLPEHCFYVDNVLAYKPLVNVNYLYYENINLYYYFIGRDDQSVNTKNMIKRIDQQIKVTKLMVSYFDPYYINIHSKLRNYLLSYLSIMLTISTVHLQLAGDEASLQKMKSLWSWLKRHNPRVYRYCRFNPINNALLVPGISQSAIEKGYKLAQKIYKFN